MLKQQVIALKEFSQQMFVSCPIISEILFEILETEMMHFKLEMTGSLQYYKAFERSTVSDG